jgi:hypothetical protein
MSTLLTSPQQRTTERPLVQVTNDEVQAQASNDQYHVEVDDAKVSTQEFDDVEVELNTKTLWIQKDKLGVRAYAPPVIAYKQSRGKRMVRSTKLEPQNRRERRGLGHPA